MNLKLFIFSFVIFFIVGSDGLFLDTIFDKIKDTTNGIRQDVRNLGNRVLGVKEPEGEHKDGLIGGAIHKLHDRVHEFWDVEEIPNECGPLWNLYNRFKQRVAKIKNHIAVNKDTQVTEPPVKLSDEEINLIVTTMDSIFNNDGTPKLSGQELEEAIKDLKKKLKAIHNKEAITTNPAEDGEGLLDIRFGERKDNKLE